MGLPKETQNTCSSFIAGLSRLLMPLLKSHLRNTSATFMQDWNSLSTLLRFASSFSASHASTCSFEYFSDLLYQISDLDGRRKWFHACEDIEECRRLVFVASGKSLGFLELTGDRILHVVEDLSTPELKKRSTRISQNSIPHFISPFYI